MSDAAGQGVTITGENTYNNWDWTNSVVFAATIVTTIGGQYLEYNTGNNESCTSLSDNCCQLSCPMSNHSRKEAATPVWKSIRLWFAGYGNVAPKTAGGRIFCILYGLCGIPLCLTWISELGSFFGDRAKRLGQVLVLKGLSVVRLTGNLSARLMCWFGFLSMTLGEVQYMT